MPKKKNKNLIYYLLGIAVILIVVLIITRTSEYDQLYRGYLSPELTLETAETETISTIEPTYIKTTEETLPTIETLDTNLDLTKTVERESYEFEPGTILVEAEQETIPTIETLGDLDKTITAIIQADPNLIDNADLSVVLDPLIIRIDDLEQKIDSLIKRTDNLEQKLDTLKKCCSNSAYVINELINDVCTLKHKKDTDIADCVDQLSTYIQGFI